MDKIYFIIIFLLISGCSVDTKSGIWKNKLDNSSDKQISNLSFDENLSFEEFKKNLVLYSYRSNFPKLDK